MNKELRILLISLVIGFGTPELMLWLAGVDNTLFTPIKRDIELSMQFFCSVVITSFAYTCPGWRQK